jgi:hypothetical protein
LITRNYDGIFVEDLNVSLNIRINTLGHSGFNACGDNSLESSLKQEKECLINQAEATWLTS